ncbi:MAG: hypothetical protein AAFP68_12230 [Pseudomonadota bacterium]
MFWSFGVAVVASALAVVCTILVFPAHAPQGDHEVRLQELRAQLQSERTTHAIRESELALHREALREAEDRASRHALEASVLRQQTMNGYVADARVEVTEANVAYALVAPKLMMSVQSLAGGSVIATFADRRRLFHVGQYHEFNIDVCECFLLLESSQHGKAVFRFGCKKNEA